jgi:hypothetical protein
MQGWARADIVPIQVRTVAEGGHELAGLCCSVMRHNGVPYALKLLAEIDEGLQQMARLELVMFGGSSCHRIYGSKDGPGRT